MKNNPYALMAALAAILSLAGCGSSDPKPPANAMRPPDPPPAAPSKGVWTKEDKIAAVQKSGMSEVQKKEAIGRINAGQM